MNRRKITEIVKFNIEKNIQSKGFIILNVLMAIFIIVSVNLNNIFGVLKEHNIELFDSDVKIEILDNTGVAKELYDESFKENEDIEINYITENTYTKENIDDDIIVVQYDFDDENILKTTITSKAGLDANVLDLIENVSKDIRTRLLSDKYNVEISKLEILNKELNIEKIMLGVDAENSDIKQTIKFASVFVVYVVLLYTLSIIANEIANEKISKSIEYVLTSVEAKEYLLAKVLSITLTILIQAIYSIIYYIIGNSINSLINNNIVESVNSVSQIDMSIITYILALFIYLIFTVFFMSMIQAALSARTTSVSEAGSTTMTLLMIVIFLYCISIGAISPTNKVSTIMYILSCVPIVSTFFVPSMMIIGQATTLQIIVSFILLVLATPILFNICSNKFKLGILDYTSKSKKNKKNIKEKSIKEEQEFLVKSKEIKRFALALGLSVIIWIICQELGILFMPTLIRNIFGSNLSETAITWIYFGIVSSISLYVPYKFIRLYTDEEYKKDKKVDFKTGFKYIAIGYCFITLIQLFEKFIIEKVGSDYNIIQGNMLVSVNDGLLEKLLFIIGISIIPGIFEEIFVRKGILNCARKYGNYFAVIVSAITFGLLHMNIQQEIFAIAIGVVFGVIYIKVGDIKVTMILHIINNGLVGLTYVLDNNRIALVLKWIFITIAIIGGFLFIIDLKKNKGKILDKEEFKEEYKMIFRNYTLDVVLIMFIVLTIVSETYLRII